MIRLFLQQMPAELTRLSQAIASDNQAEAKLIVHKLKSSVAMVGATGMINELKSIEALLGTATDSMLFWGHLNRLEQLFEEASKELEAVINE